VAQHISKTADTASGTLQAATDTLNTFPPLVESARGTLDAGPSTVTDLDAFLKRNAMHFDSTLANVDGISSQGVGILTDFRQVTDKVRADYLETKPWWKKTFRYAGDAFDTGAFIFRHY
jgi:ABC-type transporter Mla subunit MlaD